MTTPSGSPSVARPQEPRAPTQRHLHLNYLRQPSGKSRNVISKSAIYSSRHPHLPLPLHDRLHFSLGRCACRSSLESPASSPTVGDRVQLSAGRFALLRPRPDATAAFGASAPRLSAILQPACIASVRSDTLPAPPRRDRDAEWLSRPRFERYSTAASLCRLASGLPDARLARAPISAPRAVSAERRRDASAQPRLRLLRDPTVQRRHLRRARPVLRRLVHHRHPLLHRTVECVRPILGRSDPASRRRVDTQVWRDHTRRPLRHHRTTSDLGRRVRPAMFHKTGPPSPSSLALTSAVPALHADQHPAHRRDDAAGARVDRDQRRQPQCGGHGVSGAIPRRRE